ISSESCVSSKYRSCGRHARARRGPAAVADRHAGIVPANGIDAEAASSGARAKDHDSIRIACYARRTMETSRETPALPRTGHRPGGGLPRVCLLGYRHLTRLVQPVLGDYAHRARFEMAEGAFEE